jgi:aspartate aminotransferase
MSHSTEDAATSLTHQLDHVSRGKIVQIRERLLAARAKGKSVYRFESGDPSFAPAPHIVDALLAAAYAGKTHYVPNNGIPELREALAAKVAAKNRIADVTPDDVFVTNGSMHGLFATFLALLSRGDEVIIPDPMWTGVTENIRLAGGVAVGVPLRKEYGYAYRPQDIEAAITPRTTTIVLNSPHNPTGTVLTREELQSIADVARRRGLWIVADEAYEDVAFAPHQHRSIAALAGDYADRVVSIFSFSKSYAMSGLRVGYVVTRAGALRSRLPKVLRCTINGVNSLAQWAALAAVRGGDAHVQTMRTSYLMRRDMMLQSLRDLPGVHPFTPQGGFFVWAELDPSLYQRLEVTDAGALSASLASDGIGSVPGDAFGVTCTDAIRFSFSCDTSMVREGCVALREALT